MTWQRLLAGHSGIQQHQLFSNLAVSPLALIGATPVDLVTLTKQVLLEALEDAHLTLPLPHCGVVLGSSRSYQAQWEKLALEKPWKDAQSWPPNINWLETLPNTPAVTTVQLIGTQAPVLAPMAACATGLWAIAQGWELLQTQQCEQVLAGAIEAPITPLTLTGFNQMGAMAKTGAYPFDRDREGLVLGEGGAILVMETRASAERRSVPIYGRILGFGMTADAFHVSTPNPQGQGAIAAVRQCLERSQLSPQVIDYIHAHGTATVLNDRQEAGLIQALFPASVAVSSTKGATGHTLGASGALGASFCLMALNQQVLPPCVGLKNAEFDINFVQAAEAATIEHTLCFSFGFGGQNIAAAFGRA